MSESTIEQWNELARHCIMQDFPILPKPEWGQDVAYTWRSSSTR